VGRPTALTYASGKTIAYTYDKGGRLASVADWVGGKTTLAYDGASRLASLTYPNGVANTFTYDADGQVTKIAVGSIASITLAHDAAGKITSADRNLPRLPAVQNGGQQLTYDAAGQLTSATNDAMGRVTVQGASTYTWNLASQLTAFGDGVNSAAFSYDGLGEVSSSTFSGAAQTFVYNYLLHYPALSIVRQGANDLRYYVYLPDGSLLYSIEAADNTRRFYHFDEMGNTTLLTDAAGAVLDSYAITPYGEIADHLGASENPFTWQGKYGVIQEGQGLYYVRNRHYDASAARFISRDTGMSVDPRSSEPYTYAAGNPLRFIDPFGTDITLPSTSPVYSPQENRVDQDYQVGSYYAMYGLTVKDTLQFSGTGIYVSALQASFNVIAVTPGTLTVYERCDYPGTLNIHYMSAFPGSKNGPSSTTCTQRYLTLPSTSPLFAKAKTLQASVETAGSLDSASFIELLKELEQLLGKSSRDIVPVASASPPSPLPAKPVSFSELPK
jgi:RHS repeat-associated protein